MKVRKKPVVVEAIQLPPAFGAPDGFADELRAFMVGTTWRGEGYGEIEIDTIEGTMLARPGDWIIKGVHGEHYPCKPDIFEKTYEVAE